MVTGVIEIDLYVQYAREHRPALIFRGHLLARPEPMFAFKTAHLAQLFCLFKKPLSSQICYLTLMRAIFIPDYSRSRGRV
jgi:hypothetical protein